MKIRVKDRQTVLDVAVEYGGSVATGLAIADRNGLSLTARLGDGAVLEVPEGMAEGNARVVALYGARGVEPATEASGEDEVACPYGGVGFMGVEIDFEVC